MKKILFILLVIIPYLANGQAKRVRDLDEQATRVDTAVYLVDDDAYTGAAKKIKAEVLAPKINELSESSITLDKDIYQLRIDNSGTETRTDLRYVNPDITDYTTKGSNPVSGDYFLINSSGTEYKTAASAVADYVTGSLYFTTAATSAIDSRVTESYILNLVKIDTNFTFTYYTPTRDGSIYLSKIGDIVSGYITLDYGETNSAVYQTSSGLASGSRFMPKTDILVVNQDGLHVMIYDNGDIKLEDIQSGNYSTLYLGGSIDVSYSISYITD